MKTIPRQGAGILLHISSLPGPYGIGSLGRCAYDAVDFLARAGQSWWQVLPVGPTGFGDSPYQSFSAFAGNPYFIDLDLLREAGLLTGDECREAEVPVGPVDYAGLFTTRIGLLRRAWSRFTRNGAFSDFCNEQAFWLEDYALFMSVKYHMGQARWLDWPEDIRLRRPEALDHYRHRLGDEIGFWQFLQYEFYTQWRALRHYAGSRGIAIIGDMPLYVAPDSADTWSRREDYLLRPDGTPWAVAGVPPDYFSETGQLWGNSLYDWMRMRDQGYPWWRQRIAGAAALFDVVRIDHFCGVSRFWAVPAGEDTAVGGAYFPGPGLPLIQAMDEARGDMGIIAEDLGLITGELRDLIGKSGYPGMRVAQFGFDGSGENEHAADNYPQHCVAYTGTHDNETTAGFLAGADGPLLARIRERLGIPEEDPVTAWAMAEHVMSSRAGLVVIPMQDYLELDNGSRMNTPSTLGDNWRWRLTPGDLSDDLADRIRDLTERTGRGRE